VASPLETPPFGVTTTTDFATLGANLGIRWNAELKAYEVTFPGGSTGKIVPNQPGSNYGQVIASDGTVLAPFASVLKTPFAYTSWGSVGSGIVAFGIPTAPGAVPTSGSASYAGLIEGNAKAPGYEYAVYGSAMFQFNFGAGTLSGYMDPEFSGPMGVPTAPRYNFTQTVYSPGSTTFSGSFDVTGPTPSSFEGRFTGPAAQELMMRFQAPFSNYGEWGTMTGVVIGKKQ
jgi:hypothetical protein